MSNIGTTSHKLLIPIDNIHLWENNPREISDKDFQSLKGKIEKWGIWKPFLVWESKMQILGGNQRYKACKELGHKEIWVEFREPKDNAEALEMAIADNESSGEWIKSLLIEQIKLNEEKINVDDYKISLGSMQLLNLVSEPDDPIEMYKGLSDFVQNDETPFKQLLVSFESEENYNNFCKLIG